MMILESTRSICTDTRSRSLYVLKKRLVSMTVATILSFQLYQCGVIRLWSAQTVIFLSDSRQTIQMSTLTFDKCFPRLIPALRIWLFHCHIEWHIDSGLVATMIEAPVEMQNLISIPEDHQ